MRTWLFQANPRRYRIDDALAALDAIRWRAPQHAAEIGPGDLVFIWRAGSRAGIIGLGRVAASAENAPALPSEARFARTPDELERIEPRVLMAVAPVAFVPKAQVAAVAAMRGHRILTTPLGTVFPVDDAQAADLLELVAIADNPRARALIGADPAAIRAPGAPTGASFIAGGSPSTAALFAPTANPGRATTRAGAPPAIAKRTPRKLADELLRAATDSRTPTRFEQVVADAFRTLGYMATHLGGSGNTDVLVEADLPDPLGYRVAVDAKTSAHGARSAAGIDFQTLVEHRTRHGATYSAVVLPGIEGHERLTSRARDAAVVLVRAADLAELLRRHEETPLGPLDYRALFETPGLATLEVVLERASRLRRLRSLALGVVDALVKVHREHANAEPVNAHVLRGLLMADGLDPSNEEVEDVLALLSNPLVRLLLADGDGVRLATPPSALAVRLGWLAEAFATSSLDAEPTVPR